MLCKENDGDWLKLVLVLCRLPTVDIERFQLAHVSGSDVISLRLLPIRYRSCHVTTFHLHTPETRRPITNVLKRTDITYTTTTTRTTTRSCRHTETAVNNFCCFCRRPGWYSCRRYAVAAAAGVGGKVVVSN